MDEKIALAAEKIKTSKHLVVFTGAGISTESGIPDYRSQGGIWDKFKPIYFDEFMSSRTARINYWQQRLDMEKSLSVSKPNAGHLSIAKLHELGILKVLITQNIDGLHEASGIPLEKIIELHGNTRRVRCMRCKKLISWEKAKQLIDAGDKAPVCPCSGYFKPDTISFGQAMPVEETRKAVILSSKSDVFIVVGSTLLVQPAALMPEYAKNSGAFLIIINLSDTPYDKVCDVLIRGKAGNILERIVKQITP
ncbi:MAG: Sir2 family NAD-dependent protein deacetylase [Proteobacteria bacterium]|nr:Sir2 family NAD-dependent protein deacetylase [Pseudomonadota bacterium]MBU1585903.1 Sir2 family NAD-dependent protein deacetylase [Pseudomonadota bacterium]MBU2453426.1 Sir2 family NAD-dependent protein deacetylase [Pseudomonadota bacterium]MBU2627193.1 Sir2 family NAD-dependent protein deacetylase [Pseudomonadota bacterium]